MVSEESAVFSTWKDHDSLTVGHYRELLAFVGLRIPLEMETFSLSDPCASSARAPHLPADPELFD